MSALERVEKDGHSFSPQDFARQELAIACLVHRITSLSQEAMKDFLDIGAELAKCPSPEVFKEIAETMREILFPDLIGQVNQMESTVAPTDNSLALPQGSRNSWIGSKIKEKRQAAGLTQGQLAEKTGLLQGHISRLESGVHSPSFKTLERIAVAFGIKANELDYL